MGPGAGRHRPLAGGVWRSMDRGAVRRCIDGDPPYCEDVKSYHSAAGANLDLADIQAF